jgi:bifunctional UDP-N-acetylglucosamine pyrophosphorylase/glucosamine-1-phosphate N-acetyltransferase
MAPKAAPLVVLVLAAGQGKRMRSKRMKLLHEVAGQPMVAHVLQAAAALRPARSIAVVGHQAEQVRAALDGHCDRFALQREQRGTAHAVLQAASRLRGQHRSTLLILNGDVPAMQPATLRALVNRHRRSGAALTLLSAEIDDPTGYGRIVRDAAGNVERIIEHRDADRAVRRIREINVGVYCTTPATLLPILRKLTPDNAQGELYLTDAAHHLIDRGRKVLAVCHGDAHEVLGVNDRIELADASARLYARKAEQLQRAGVTLLEASRTWIDPRARVGRDTVIYPDVIVEGASTIGEDCIVRPGCRIVDSRIGKGVEIKDHSVILESRVGNGAAVGPFAHLRPASELGAEVRVGNFVEVKKARLGRGTKASHLSYIGDASIGDGCNIGAGTITCNYDGQRKMRTVLGKRVFIGSDTQLVAPVKLGNDVYVAAGTTVTKDVPAGSLALSRVRQKNKHGWVARKKKKNAKPASSGRSGAK